MVAAKILSFPRKWESIFIKEIWIPVCTGMTKISIPSKSCTDGIKIVYITNQQQTHNPLVSPV